MHISFQQYLEDYQSQTAKGYVRVVEHFLFHSKRKQKSSYTDIIDYLLEHNLKHPRDISGLKCYFNYLIETNQREDHPCKTLNLGFSKSDVQFQELLTGEELELLLTREERYQELTQRNKAILSLLIYQGLSSANIENLRMEDVDMDDGAVYIRATSKLKRRILELKPKQFHLLFTYITESRKKLENKTIKTNALFISKLGNPFLVDNLNRMLKPMKSLFPYKNLNARMIRKSVIANWINEMNIPMEDVQLLSGQKWISTTQRYVRPDMADRREKINEYFPI